MDLSTITIADFKARFYRDFTYATIPPANVPFTPDPDFVQDQDITNAFSDAVISFNQGLFSEDSTIRSAYLYLTAHYLCLIIREANSGINSPANQIVSARSVGSVSESYSIPQEYADNPILAGYLQTSYGQKYLSMVLPAIVGNVVAVLGFTHP